MRLVLASASPQRRAILEGLGVPFEVRPSDVEELDEGEPHAVAWENARRKALAVAASAPEDATVLGVDTLVALPGRILGKPRDAGEAASHLTALGGREHTVVSGLVVVAPGGEARGGTAATRVRFRALPEERRRWYVGTGEWAGRAGGYAIQGRGAALVAGIEGDYLNVVGLPVPLLLDVLPGLLP